MLIFIGVVLVFIAMLFAVGVGRNLEIGERDGETSENKQKMGANILFFCILVVCGLSLLIRY